MTAAPLPVEGKRSPWAGMSGSALFAGPILLGVVVMDPGRFGTNRVMAAPLTATFADGFERLAGYRPEFVDTGPLLQLSIPPSVTLQLRSDYVGLPAGFDLQRAPWKLLEPEYGIVEFIDDAGNLAELEQWCTTGAYTQFRVIVGDGGSGKS